MRGAILARPAKSEAAVTAPESGEPTLTLQGTQTLRRECSTDKESNLTGRQREAYQPEAAASQPSEGSRVLIGDPLDEGAILARPNRRAPEAAESQPLEGSSMFIGDPLW